MRRDLTLHIIAGFLLGGIITCLTHSWAFGVAFSALVGLAKEMWDKYHPPHVSDFADFIATVVGGVMGTILGVLIDYLV